MKFRVLGVNSGLGVSLFPFRKYLIGNIETRRIFHTPGDEQWKLNFKAPLFKAYYSELFKEVCVCDVIISSPDCGSGSILRFSRAKKLGDHTKNNSLLQFFDGVNSIKPKFFYFENLEGLFKSFPKERFKELLKDYYLVEHCASVLHWGNSQVNRKRLVIIGIRKDLPYKKIKKYFKLPEKKKPKTCLELYGDLDNVKLDLDTVRNKPISGHRSELNTEVISIYGGKRMSLLEIAVDWQTRLKGKKRYYVPEHEKRRFKTAPGVYRNLGGSFPATARKANRQFDHKGYTLTPRQLARVQGVPDEFKIYIDLNKLKYWINKGRTVVTKTPPYEISVWFKKQLKKSYRLWK